MQGTLTPPAPRTTAPPTPIPPTRRPSTGWQLCRQQALWGAVKGLEREAASICSRSENLLSSVRSLSRSKETMKLQADLAKHYTGGGAQGTVGMKTHREALARSIAGMEKHRMY